MKLHVRHFLKSQVLGKPFLPRGTGLLFLSDDKYFVINHISLFNMAARLLNAKFEVQAKWILMTCVTMSFSSSFLDSLIYTFPTLDFCFLFTF